MYKDRKAKRRTTVRRAVKFALALVAEILAGLAAGAITAAVTLPLAYEYRGYTAVGGEWCLIIAMAYAGFSVCDNLIFKE